LEAYVSVDKEFPILEMYTRSIGLERHSPSPPRIQGLSGTKCQVKIASEATAASGLHKLQQRSNSGPSTLVTMLKWSLFGDGLVCTMRSYNDQENPGKSSMSW
jgi:hypothetical protein